MKLTYLEPQTLKEFIWWAEYLNMLLGGFHERIRPLLSR
jgi:hypothetical protein